MIVGDGYRDDDRDGGDGNGNGAVAGAREDGAGKAAAAAVVVPREGVMGGRLEGEPEKTLQEARFVIGDFISCAVFAPGADGSVAPVHHAGRGTVGARGGSGGAPLAGRGGDGGCGGASQ